MKTWILILLFPMQITYAQEMVTLEEFCRLARENYPKIRNKELITQISQLKLLDLNAGNLPVMTVQGQATWQSDVTRVEIPGALFSVPSLSKDQYRTSVDIRQVIWDGGLAEAGRKAENAMLRTMLSDIELELYRLNEQVSTAFFTYLVLEKQVEALLRQKETLEAQLEKTRSAIENGVAESVQATLLQAELLQITLSVSDLASARETAGRVLSLLSGREVSPSTILKYAPSAIITPEEVIRPELLHFDLLKDQLDHQKGVISRSRLPKIFGFGQVGYGNPGLNMLKNEFVPWLVVGGGISWSITDWGKSQRARQAIEFQQETIENEEQAFLHNLEILRQQQWEKVLNLQKQLNTDRQLLELRHEIAMNAASRMANGTITTADYVREINLETIAGINLATRSLQIDEAYFKYLIISGINTNK